MSIGLILEFLRDKFNYVFVRIRTFIYRALGVQNVRQIAGIEFHPFHVKYARRNDSLSRATIRGVAYIPPFANTTYHFRHKAHLHPEIVRSTTAKRMRPDRRF